MKHGITRSVLLIGNVAIKLPSVRNGWRHFLHGLQSNMTERAMSVLHGERALAPVLWALPGGWLLVQRRCVPLTDHEWAVIDAVNGDIPCGGNWFGFDCDFKRENFGTIDGAVVLLDYGELT